MLIQFLYLASMAEPGPVFAGIEIRQQVALIKRCTVRGATACDVDNADVVLMDLPQLQMTHMARSTKTRKSTLMNTSHNLRRHTPFTTVPF